jgi:hypothetical protein
LDVLFFPLVRARRGPTKRQPTHRVVDRVAGKTGAGRVLRTSNSYAFTYPHQPTTDRFLSKSEKPGGTPNQAFFSSLAAAFAFEGDRVADFSPVWRGKTEHWQAIASCHYESCRNELKP